MPPYTDADIPVFVGPTLYKRPLAPPFVQLPPAGAGDLLRLLLGPPRTVVLIDGVFDERPAVRHKEILVLLAHGFRVIGGASMGALRAAELHDYGMVGCGSIFEAYRIGRLTADDEVAVVHGEAQHGWKPFSIPQVNVRATLARSVRLGLLDATDARRLRDRSASIPFRERVWMLFAPELRAYEVDLKRRDAEQALALATELAPLVPERTAMPPVTSYLMRLSRLVEVELEP